MIGQRQSVHDAKRSVFTRTCLHSDITLKRRKLPNHRKWFGVLAFHRGGCRSRNRPSTLIYPLLTQAVEISLDEQSLALEVRPRATETKPELDAFVACQLRGAAEVDRAIREHLSKHKDKPVCPFDASTYTDVLKLAVGALDSQGAYVEVLASNRRCPAPGGNLIVTDAWALFSRVLRTTTSLKT